MNRDQLRNILSRNNIPSDCYSLEGGLPNEAYCLSENGLWEVYYSERGYKQIIGHFKTEDKACECLLNTMKQNFNIS